MSDTPAAIDRSSGVLYINPRLYNRLTAFQQRFVKLHEMGHYRLQTDDEIKADAYAFDRLAGTEFRSLKQCLACLEDILDVEHIPAHKARYNALYQRALQWDAEHPNKTTGKDVQAIYALETLLSSVQTNQTVSNATSTTAVQNNNNMIVIAVVAILALFIFFKFIKD